MSQIPFSADWLNQLSDPYAVLGLSVTADDRRVLKRYRSVAKLLHPDRYATSDTENRQIASQLFARLVNPAYQKLKQSNGRADVLALLRLYVRRFDSDQVLNIQSDAARQLLHVSVPEIDVFYEQAVTQLADSQFQKLDYFSSVTQELGELNLVYLRLKTGSPMTREKRTGIVTYEPPKPPAATPEPVSVNYAQRHCERAQEYMKKSNWSLAIQELKDAIRIEKDKGEYHSLLAIAYLKQNLPGMAKVHFRQALKYSPKDPIALSYAKQLGIQVDSPNREPAKRGGLFGLFAKKQ